jgi:hypothetical protein
MGNQKAQQIDPHKMFMQAENFVGCYDLLMQADHAKYAAFTANPIVVISAFASEIFLKCLLNLEGAKIPQTHNLETLFQALSADTRARVTELWDAEVESKKAQWAAAQGDNPAPLDLPTALKDGGHTFDAVRYAHEGDVKCRFVMGDLPRVLRAVILEKKPEWDKVQRKVHQKSVSGIDVTQTRTVGHAQGPDIDNP